MFYDVPYCHAHQVRVIAESSDAVIALAAQKSAYAFTAAVRAATTCMVVVYVQIILAATYLAPALRGQLVPLDSHIVAKCDVCAPFAGVVKPVATATCDPETIFRQPLPTPTTVLAPKFVTGFRSILERLKLGPDPELLVMTATITPRRVLASASGKLAPFPLPIARNRNKLLTGAELFSMCFAKAAAMMLPAATRKVANSHLLSCLPIKRRVTKNGDTQKVRGLMMGLAIAVCGVVCLIAGYAVEGWDSVPETVDEVLEDSPADDHDWAGEKIHDLDAA